MTDTMPPFARAALLLDLDGTLLDLAPTPDAVVVAPGLKDALARLCGELDGALAVVTGRPIETVDALLPGIVPAVAGEHGGAYRSAPGAAITRPVLETPPADWVAQAEAFAAARPGVLLERKARGFVLHYRLAPEMGPAIQAEMAKLVATRPEAFQLLPSHMAWELRPHGADKGVAVDHLMALPTFAGRLPVFIGDDVTDEDGMVVARRMGGAGLFVPSVFGSPAGVRSWLERSHGDWAAFKAG
jgi:trehalose 6-phosphate phosphatase